MTSDAYFNLIQNNNPLPSFDLIFIDGDHTKEQVKRDFENSLRFLSDTGFIVVHDVLPENEAGTKVPRVTKQWWGDVYKWAMNISSYNGIDYITFNIDNGCMLVWKDADMQDDSPVELPYPINWHTYKEYGSALLNVTDAVEI